MMNLLKPLTKDSLLKTSEMELEDIFNWVFDSYKEKPENRTNAVLIWALWSSYSLGSEPINCEFNNITNSLEANLVHPYYHDKFMSLITNHLFSEENKDVALDLYYEPSTEKHSFLRAIALKIEFTFYQNLLTYFGRPDQIRKYQLILRDVNEKIIKSQIALEGERFINKIKKAVIDNKRLVFYSDDLNGRSEEQLKSIFNYVRGNTGYHGHLFSEGFDSQKGFFIDLGADW